MKIAIVSDDEQTISAHFGKAPLFVVATIDSGKVLSKETRAKAGHHSNSGNHEHRCASGKEHGYDTGARARHESMLDTISDCQVLIAGGMGWGAYDAIQCNNIEPIINDVKNIDEAIEMYIHGNLTNQMNFCR
jgi:predicted Fe-Mo cluster-binding NifX family protein